MESIDDCEAETLTNRNKCEVVPPEETLSSLALFSKPQLEKRLRTQADAKPSTLFMDAASTVVIWRLNKEKNLIQSRAEG
ncbi:hypothetical protein SAY86_009832 [Trapa natans]|uniref:Uncharacterized protein n=1 Tax=Trapa natans TaxID=22666 RepID=A0AAN7KWQ2_TRANT|nr:hypothetical protein SAY86_009832 [Trapa natans]